MAGHHQFDDAVAAPALGRGVLGQAQQAWLTVDQRPERLAHHDGLRAAAADPALDRAVRVDDPGRARTRRGRPLDRHDRGDRERPAGRLELGGPREDRARGHVTYSRVREAGGAVGTMGVPIDEREASNRPNRDGRSPFGSAGGPTGGRTSSGSRLDAVASLIGTPTVPPGSRRPGTRNELAGDAEADLPPPRTSIN